MNRAPAQLLPHGARQARQILQAAPIVAIPAETLAGSLQLIPANAGVGLVEQEAVAAIHGEIFRRKARIVPGAVSPDENAFNVGIAKGQDGLFAVEGANEFAQDEAQRFRHAAVHFQLPGELREKLLFGGVAPLAAAEECDARPGGKRPGGKRNPGHHLVPGQRAVDGRSNQKSKRDDAGQHDGTPRPPTNSRSQGNEQVDEPERHDRSSEDQEHGQRGQIEGKRKRQLSDPLQILHQRQDQRHDQVDGNEEDGMRAALGGRAVQ